MKNIILILFAVVICSCGLDCRYMIERSMYVLHNNSGHTITIETESFDPSFPNKLTLKHGETFSWEPQFGLIIDAISPSLFKVTFDGTYTIDHKSFIKHRNPLTKSNYVINEEEWLTTATYTFTDEDYEIAKKASQKG